MEVVWQEDNVTQQADNASTLPRIDPRNNKVSRVTNAHLRPLRLSRRAQTWRDADIF